MKKWLVVLLVLLALIILVAPGIVGRMAEKNIEESINWVEEDARGVVIEQESFDRGWFSSAGRHRISLDNTQFGEAATAYQDSTGHPELPALVVDTELDHGPLPGGALSPGLARTVSTFQLDPGNGELTPLPGTMTSTVGLDGTSDSRLLVETGSHQFDGTMLNWDGADLRFKSNPRDGSLSAEGTMSAIRAEGDGDVIEVDGMTINTNQVRTEYGIAVGEGDVEIGRIEIESEGTAVAIGSTKFAGTVSLDNERFSGDSEFAMSEVSIPGVGEVGIDVELGIDGADAASLGVIIEALQEAQSAADPAVAFESIYPNIETELQTLINKGFGFTMDRMNVSLPQGTISSDLQINIPENDDDAAFSWGAVLLGMNGTFNLRVPGAVYELAAMMNPQAGAMVAMGLLRADGDDYVMEAQYEQGLVNVNGAPMPLPIPIQ